MTSATEPIGLSEEELISRDGRARDTVATDLDRTLFVEAGAGTGKTTALVDRIVRLVLTPDSSQRRSLAQIAAITFTEAAAAELRERIRSEFERHLLEAAANANAEIVARCQQALADADVAAISTLHAFAQRLLSEFPVEVDVPPRVEVLDEVRSQLAFDARWGDFLDSLYDDPAIEEFVVRAAILNVRLDSKPLRDIAHAFDDNWDRLLDVDLTDRRATPIDFSAVREGIHRVRQIREECTDPSDLLLAKMLGAESTFERFERAKSDHERLRLTKLIHALKFNQGRKPNWPDVVDAREVGKALSEAAGELCARVSAETLTQIAKRVAQFSRDSAEERRREGQLEFHDLLVLALRLLRTSPEARSSLSERYRILMLDEFQDTDPIQISLAMLLVAAVDGSYEGEWSDLDAEPGRLFMVGDPKQSIYRFRRAEVELFLKARDKFGAGGVALQRNFRTVRPIIEAVNSLFGELMPEDTVAQAAYAPLVPAREPDDDVDHRPLIFGVGSSGKANEIREAEASDVASIIAEILAEPAKWPVFDRATQRWRAPTLSDITILVPTRTSLPQLSRALDERHIPFRADTGQLVYETAEINDLLNALQAIDDPSDQIALVAALRSPLYGCGYDDLARFRQLGGSFDLHAAVPDAAVGSLVAEGIEHLRSLAARRWWDEPSQLLLRLIEDRHAMALPAKNRRARDVWRRIRFVVDQARAFAEAGGGDLREYLAWTRLQGADGSKVHEPMLPEPDDVAVQIMTIHGSKGLEFPITIVSGLTTRWGNRAKGGQVVWPDQPAVMPEVSVSSTVRTAHFDVRRELDDEMDGPERDRLLYVALTRARDHLAVSGHHVLNAKGEDRKSVV